MSGRRESGGPGAAAVAFARTVSFGRIVGVALPPYDAFEALAVTLPLEERAHARGLPAARRVTFAGGRIALRRALEDLGLPAPPLLATARGGPALPPGVSGSIAHKPALAVALAAPAPVDVTLGVDIEVERGLRFDIAPRVLTPAEHARIAALPDAARARAVLEAFAAKEAVYKALDPWLRRYVAFQEVEIDGPRGTFAPRAGEPSFDIAVCAEPLDGYVLVTARVQRRARRGGDP
jgi:4'-phosphopantetheinyl transferase EntD